MRGGFPEVCDGEIVRLRDPEIEALRCCEAEGLRDRRPRDRNIDIVRDGENKQVKHEEQRY